MATSYRGQVTTAFEVLADGLAPFVDEHMSRAYPDEDWILKAADKLGKRPDVIVSLRDPHFQLEVMNRWWGPVFAPVMDGDSRQAMLDLRVARNHWAHPDEDHPFDLDYAIRVHELAEDILSAVGSEDSPQMTALLGELRRAEVRATAERDGVSESEALVAEFVELHRRHEELTRQLEQERTVAASAQGRERAMTRQLAELQTQYAAVSNLRASYEVLQAQIDAQGGSSESADQDAEALRQQLLSAEITLAGLQRESTMLRGQLEEARVSIRDIDPLQTDAGRRWLWLMASLLITLGIMVLMVVSLEPT